MRTKLAKGAMLVLLWVSWSPDFGYAQQWSGILDPSRAVDWTQAGFTIREPASQCSNQTGSYSPSGGDDAATINSLIAGCRSGGYIQLSAGTFHFSSSGLKFDAVTNVVIRGAGPEKTKLVMTAFSRCFYNAYVCVSGNTQGPRSYGSPKSGSGSTAWTGDNGVSGSYAKGDVVIDLGSTSSLSVGQPIMLDQDDDSYGLPTSGIGCSETGNTVTCNTTTAHNFKVGDTVAVGGTAIPPKDDCGQGKAAGYAGYWTVTAVPGSASFQYTDTHSGLQTCTGGFAAKDTGGAFVANLQNETIDENNGYIGRSCPDSLNSECPRLGRSQRNQLETHVITAIAGNQVTISPPLMMNNWRASQNPAVFWTGSYPGKYATGDGIEDLTIDSSTGPAASGGTVEFFNASRSWLNNTRVISGDTEHVLIVNSTNIDVLDNYFFGSRNGQNKTYGVDIYGGASNNLIQNNIFQHIPACMMNEGGYGSVWSYNYCVDNAYNSTGWLPEALSMNHGVVGMLLFEGNDTPAAEADDIHGSSVGITMFRSRARGNDTPTKIENTFALAANAFNRGMNVIGSVLGTMGTQTQYLQASPGYLARNVYRLGYTTETGSAVPYDSLVPLTLLRWGNYDVVTGAVRWCGNSSSPGWSSVCGMKSEIPTAAVPFISGNFVPSSTTLPASFYLSTQPVFWNMALSYGPTPPWPAIGPDVSGGTAPDGVGGFSYAIPAQLCYQNTPIDRSYQNSSTVDGATWSSRTATLTTKVSALAVDDTISVTGVSPSGYNGTWQVKAVTSSSVSFSLPTNPGPYVSGGTLSSPNILLFDAANCYAYLQNNPLKSYPPKNLVVTGVQ